MKTKFVVTLVALSLATAALFAGTDAKPAPPPATPQPVPAMTVYKDPVTGRLGPVPADKLRALLSANERRALSSSSEGLVEKAAPGGGIMYDLQGRFQSVMWATTGANGAVTGQCDQVAPEPTPRPPTASSKEKE